MVHPQQRNQPQGDGRGEGPKGAKGGGLPSQSAASTGVGTVQGSHTPLESSKWEGAGGEMQSGVVFSQFQVESRREAG